MSEGQATMCRLLLIVVACATATIGIQWSLINNPDLNPTTCPDDRRVFIQKAESTVKCLAICSQYTDGYCNVASFVLSATTCYGCGTIEVKVDSFIRDDPTLYDYLISGPRGIPDNQLSASSIYSNILDHGPQRARLHTVATSTGNGGWVPANEDSTPYIQADFVGIRYIKGIVTQGRYNDGYLQWVTSYKMATSLDCSSFTMIKDSDSSDMIFPGNYDSVTLVTNMLDVPVFARCIHIYPWTHFTFCALRFDIYGI